MAWFMSEKTKYTALAVAAFFALALVAGCGSSQIGSSSASQSSESANAVVDSSSSADNEDRIRIEVVDYTKDFINGGDNAMVMYETADGIVLYDLDIEKEAVTNGQSAAFIEDGDAGLDYILANGYPNKTYTNNKGMDAYITQMAIWWYVDEGALSSNFKNLTADEDEYGLVERTRELVEGAKNATSSDDSSSAKIYATDNTNVTRLVGLFK